MRSIRGKSVSIDQRKLSVGLELQDMKDNEYYLVGDQAEGKVTVVTKEDMHIQKITLELHFVLKTKDKTYSFRRVQARLAGALFVFAGQPQTFQFKSPYRFQQTASSGKPVASYWEVKVRVHYDHRQFKEILAQRLVNKVFSPKPYSIAFECPVSYGRGSYQVMGRALPVRTYSMRRIILNCIACMVLFFFALLFLGERSPYLPLVMAAIVYFLVVQTGREYIKFQTLQDTPMKLSPSQDGQLRLELLNRGNNQFAKASVGYRVKSYYEISSNDYEHNYDTILLEKVFAFNQLARSRDHLFEVMLPWPKVQVPTSYVTEKAGYKWELFIRIPSPFFGKKKELTWPIQVDWEPFRLPNEPTETLRLPNLAEQKIPRQR